MKRFNRRRLPSILKHCTWCTEPFVTKREHGKYCSDQCKRHTYILRKAEKLIESGNSKPGIIQRILNFFKS
jgi:hypothetical protein